jgi:peptidoglycan/LPS O-acetylase OafA/YrhL
MANLLVPTAEKTFAEPDLNMGRRYVTNLDIVRFLASLWVVFTHYGFIGPSWGKTGYQPPEGIFALFLKMGYLGVPIFFVLSGFVIAHVSMNIHPVKFALNRVIRLMPAFWICLTLSFLLLSFLGTPDVLSVPQLIANYTLAPQVFGFEFVDGVYWTLFYEFIFYGFATLLIAVGIFHKRMLTICAVWLAISFANNLYIEHVIFERLFISYFAGAFVGGMVLWHGWQKAWTLYHVALLTLAALSLALGVQKLDTQDFLPNFEGTMGYLPALGYAIFTLGTVYLALLLPQIKRFAGAALLLGGISYPLYLFHQEVGYALMRNFVGTEFIFLSVVLIMTCTVIFCGFLHLFLERPARKVLASLVSGVREKYLLSYI